MCSHVLHMCSISSVCIINIIFISTYVVSFDSAIEISVLRASQQSFAFEKNDIL
jgi:hypothetical protein